MGLDRSEVSEEFTLCISGLLDYSFRHVTEKPP